jgi:hypothetical protein
MDVSQLIQSINSVTATGQINNVDEQQRTQLSQACDQLKNLCESPLERTAKLLFSVRLSVWVVVIHPYIPWTTNTDGPEAYQAVALRLGVDLKLFDAVVSRSSQEQDGKVNVHQIAEDTKADPTLLSMLAPSHQQIQLIITIGMNQDVLWGS